jgi:hypothetical protein
LACFTHINLNQNPKPWKIRWPKPKSKHEIVFLRVQGRNHQHIFM